MLTFQSCEECDSLAVSGEVDAHDPTLLHMFCRECGAQWDDYDD